MNHINCLMRFYAFQSYDSSVCFTVYSNHFVILKCTCMYIYICILACVMTKIILATCLLLKLKA